MILFTRKNRMFPFANIKPVEAVGVLNFGVLSEWDFNHVVMLRETEFKGVESYVLSVS